MEELIKKMRRRGMTVLDSKIPEPDGQFRLRPCKKCGDAAPVYVKLRERNEELWRVCCLGCFSETEGHRAQHDAQMVWNEVERSYKRKRVRQDVPGDCHVAAGGSSQ